MKKHIKYNNPNIIYLYSPYGFGDTLILAGLKEAIEEKYESSVHYLIKAKHEAIMDLYQISNYSIVDSKDINEITKIDVSHNIIKKGHIFIAHPLFLSESTLVDDLDLGRLSFLEMYLKLFNLDNDINLFKYPNHYPQISSLLKEKLKKYGIDNNKKIVLLMPEANTSPLIPTAYWIKLAKKYKKQGYSVISNVSNKKLAIKYSKYIPLSIYELIELASICTHIISIRSGLCDILAFSVGDKLEVVYPNINILNSYSLKRAYNIKNQKEQIIQFYKEINKISLFFIPIFKFVKIHNTHSSIFKIFNFKILEQSED